MGAINRDTIIALLLLLLSGALFQSTFSIRGLMLDATMGPELWPRIVIGVFAFLSLIYLVQSVRGKYRAQANPEDEELPGDQPAQDARRFINPIACIVSFAAFMVLQSLFGFFSAGFVFLMAVLTTLGPKTKKAAAIHLIVSAITIAVLWALFSVVLRMYLPRGTLLHLF